MNDLNKKIGKVEQILINVALTSMVLASVSLGLTTAMSPGGILYYNKNKCPCIEKNKLKKPKSAMDKRIDIDYLYHRNFE